MGIHSPQGNLIKDENYAELSVLHGKESTRYDLIGKLNMRMQIVKEESQSLLDLMQLSQLYAKATANKSLTELNTKILQADEEDRPTLQIADINGNDIIHKMTHFNSESSSYMGQMGQSNETQNSNSNENSHENIVEMIGNKARQLDEYEGVVIEMIENQKREILQDLRAGKTFLQDGVRRKCASAQNCMEVFLAEPKNDFEDDFNINQESNVSMDILKLSQVFLALCASLSPVLSSYHKTSYPSSTISTSTLPPWI